MTVTVTEVPGHSEHQQGWTVVRSGDVEVQINRTVPKIHLPTDRWRDEGIIGFDQLDDLIACLVRARKELACLIRSGGPVPWTDEELVALRSPGLRIRPLKDIIAAARSRRRRWWARGERP